MTASESNNQREGQIPQKTALRKVSKVYKWLGGIFIGLGLFLLIGSIIVATNGDRVNEEPIVGAFALFGGLPLLFASYVGEAIDDIRSNTAK